MELKVGIYGEREEDFPEGERLLGDFYRSAGIIVPILRFTSVRRLSAYCSGLTGKGKIFFPVLASRAYMSKLLPAVEKLSGKTDDQRIDNVTLEIILADFPYPKDFCQTYRERFLPPVRLYLPARDIPKEFIPEQILYIETSRRNVLIHTEKEVTEIFLTITEMKKKLGNNPSIVQPHISFLVNLAWASRVEGYDIVLKNGERVPLSQKRSSDFRDTLHQYLSSLL